FEARLARGRPEGRELLELAAVAGDVVPLGLLAAVSGAGQATLLDLLGEAEDLGLVRTVGPGRHGFTHPILRATILQRLRVGTRVRLHARIGAALEAAHDAGEPVDLAALAYHYSRAAPGGTAPA